MPIKSLFANTTFVHSPETYGTSTRYSPLGSSIAVTCKHVSAGSAAVQTSKYK